MVINTGWLAVMNPQQALRARHRLVYR